MTDTYVNPNTSNVNSSFDRRREERAVEQIAQDMSNRWTELAASQMEVMQKIAGLNAQLANFWVDSFQATQGAITHGISQLNQNRRAV